MTCGKIPFRNSKGKLEELGFTLRRKFTCSYFIVADSFVINICVFPFLFVHSFVNINWG